MSETPSPDLNDARWDEIELSRIVRDLMKHFEARDRKLELRDALVFRRVDHEQETGQYIPAPFDRSPTLVKHSSGILIDRVQHLAAKASENYPNIQVNMLGAADGSTTTAVRRKAKSQEDALNAILWENDRQGYNGSLLQQQAFSAVTKGVGWYHSYENELGWKVPSRVFYETLTEEEVQRLKDAEEITDAFPGAGEEFQYAESLDLWRRRRESAMRENATAGERLFILEALPPGCVYYRRDHRGISLAAIVEIVPSWEMENEWGVVEDGRGNIVIGADRGTSMYDPIADRYWIRVRVWSRDEHYVMVSRQQGGKLLGRGQIVYFTKHDYGEVPLWPAAATMSDSGRPDEEFLPLLEGAYSLVPGYQQIMTLLSNAAIFNMAPRYIIVKTDGSPVIDPDTSQPMIFETNNVAGIDPQFAAIIETGGGEFRQLKIEGVGDMVAIAEMYARAIDQTLPPEAAMGASGANEPAWGTRLKQAASQVKITPVVKNNAAAITSVARFWSRVIKHRDQKVFVYARPQRRGQTNNVRSEVNLDPKDVTLDLSVRQESMSAEERIVQQEMGVQLRYPQNGRPIIDDLEFYENFLGSDDPFGMIKRARAQEIADKMFVEEVAPRVIQRLRGRITEATPAEQREEARVRSDVKATDLTGAAGIRQAGVEMGAVQDQMPPLEMAP